MRPVGTAMTSLVRALVRCAFPRYCVFCGSPVAGCLCTPCRESLPVIDDACETCGVPLLLARPHAVSCADCQLGGSPFARARAALHYRFPVDAALKALKFRRQLHYVPVFASLLLPLAETAFPGIDALAPVPLHRFRHALRGFNQAHELAKPLSRRLGLPIVTSRRLRYTRPQTGLSASARRRNVHNAFAAPRPLGRRHPLIIDDVMTTGETCRQLAAALARAGAEQVSVLTVARAAPYAGRNV